MVWSSAGVCPVWCWPPGHRMNWQGEQKPALQIGLQPSGFVRISARRFVVGKIFTLPREGLSYSTTMRATFLAYAWASSPERIVVAAAVTLCFALLARGVRGVAQSGAVAGGIVCFALFASAGPGAFAALATLFVATWTSTRLGYRRKQELGLAERREGRNAWQVLANLVAAAVAALIFAATGTHVWLNAMIAALAAAAADTVASEIGQSIRRDARMITTGKRVPAGTDGGITVPGTAAGLAASVAVTAVAAATGVIDPRCIWIPVVAGFAGMVLDSILGATLQRRGWISNEGVNLWSTLAAAVAAYAVRP